MSAPVAVDPRTDSPYTGWTAALPRPGFVERVYVIAAMVLYAVDIPTNWFTRPVNAAQALAAASNTSTGPLASIVFLAIAGIAGLVLLPHAGLAIRVAGRARALQLLIGWICLSTFWSVDVGTTARRSIALAATMLFATYIVCRFDLREILRLAAIACLIITALNLMWVTALPTYGKAGDNVTGVLSHKNSLGQLSALCAVTLLLVGIGQRSTRLWAWPGVAAAAYLAIASDSKTTLASLALLVALLVVFQLFRARRTLFGAVAIGLVSASVLAALVATANLPFIAEQLGKDPTLTGRTQLWSALNPAVAERPLFGYGWDAFWRGWESPAHEIWLQNDWLPPHAHNAGYDALLHIGIVGLVLIGAYFLKGVADSAVYLRDNRSAIAGFPLAMMSFQLLFSISEQGIIDRELSWLLVTSMVLVVANARSPRLSVSTATTSEARVSP